MLDRSATNPNVFALNEPTFFHDFLIQRANEIANTLVNLSLRSLHFNGWNATDGVKSAFETGCRISTGH